MKKMNKETGITIKGGNVTRLGLLNKILSLTDKLTQKELRGEWTYGGYEERPFKGGEIESIAGVYKSVAESIASIDTNSQGITITNCTFKGIDRGVNVETAPDELLSETTEEGIIEE